MIHDFKHPGLNNNYLINSKNYLAIRYNDISVLENMHIAEAFKLIKQESTNIMSGVSFDERKAMRKRIIDCVLATDMAKHTSQVSWFRTMLDSNGIK